MKDFACTEVAERAIVKTGLNFEGLEIVNMDEPNSMMGQDLTVNKVLFVSVEIEDMNVTYVQEIYRHMIDFEMPDSVEKILVLEELETVNTDGALLDFEQTSDFVANKWEYCFGEREILNMDEVAQDFVKNFVASMADFAGNDHWYFEEPVIVNKVEV